MDTSHDWDTELHRLAGGIVPPDVIVADDLARGRRRARRNRLTAVSAVAATATVIAGTAWLATPDPRASDGDDIAVTTTSADPTPAAPVDRVLPLVDPEEEVWEPDNLVTLQAWRDVLAEHLDPTGTHLEQKPSNEQSGGGEAGTLTLGTKLGWSIPGQRGLGLVQISVSSAAEKGDWGCGDDPAWVCHDATAPGGLRAQGAVHDGVRAVRVARADGEVVILAVDNLFGNNSTVPVSGVDVDEADLLAAAADPRLTLPDKIVEHQMPEFVEPPAEAVLRAAIQEHLVGPGETVELISFEDTYVDAVLTRDGVRQGRIIVSIGADAWPDGPTCLRTEYAGCVERTVGERKVFVGRFREGQENNAAWTVIDPGDKRSVTVTFLKEGSGTYDDARAAAFVVAPELQR